MLLRQEGRRHEKSPCETFQSFSAGTDIVYFFFALAGAVCLQLFVQARTLSQQTHARNQALVCAKNISALFEAGEGSFSEILREYPDAQQRDSLLTIYYDEEWQPCTLEQETYLLTLTLSESSWEEHLLKGEIQVTDKEEPLCTLDVSCYIPLKAGEGS